jgi:hypothetical protein
VPTGNPQLTLQWSQDYGPFGHGREVENGFTGSSSMPNEYK